MLMDLDLRRLLYQSWKNRYFFAKGSGLYCKDWQQSTKLRRDVAKDKLFSTISSHVLIVLVEKSGDFKNS